MATNGAADALVNDQTDRIYLVSKDGLVQCLHELGADKPLYHNPPEVKPAGEVAPETGPVGPAPREPGTPRTSPAAENPFGAVPPATKGESPFGSAGAGGTAPAGAAPPAGQTPPGGAAGGAENPFEFDR
jgi:hypothetical protein